jgi:hypothetical protein
MAIFIFAILKGKFRAHLAIIYFGLWDIDQAEGMFE